MSNIERNRAALLPDCLVLFAALTTAMLTAAGYWLRLRQAEEFGQQKNPVGFSVSRCASLSHLHFVLGHCILDATALLGSPPLLQA
ncbi:MAG: hypothetical protein ACREAB_12815 [Blastocatellia bacterium]